MPEASSRASTSPTIELVVTSIFVRYELSVESYYKKMHNMIAYKEGSSYFGTSQDWQDKVETNGNGESLGIEFLLQKKEGKTTGWISYTLSKTTRRFNNINNGKTYPSNHDKPHAFNLVANYKFSRRLSISSNLVYSTGRPITYPVGVFYMNKKGVIIPLLAFIADEVPIELSSRCVMSNIT